MLASNECQWLLIHLIFLLTVCHILSNQFWEIHNLLYSPGRHYLEKMPFHSLSIFKVDHRMNGLTKTLWQQQKQEKEWDQLSE